jgi:ribosomal protein L25 (general stress protein Ctc)
VKIRAIKYEYEQNNKTMNISIDAQEFIKAILKDALNGEIRLVAKR